MVDEKMIKVQDVSYSLSTTTFSPLISINHPLGESLLTMSMQVTNHLWITMWKLFNIAMECFYSV